MIVDLIDVYYKGIARKDGWQEPLSNSFRFIAPGGRVTEGKGAYVETNSRFLRGVKATQRKEMLTDGNTACVWMSYQLVSPGGREISLDALEIWTGAENELASLTIYFDTAAFGAFLRDG